ncbi:MAG TPA: FAD-dependent oxidoreductase [Leptospiraceae bacterium]|nr:FAD-dependent oxidoreductase [Leptospiraceae bacterium]HMY66875.1 FAD-dependent oxidoreductase [Leptospiraceae bacterium]HNF23961.1 FAD-dependent oxidoreductase [Leptospiraceae bacterium]HNI94672.1 FAD-dependent oxidoreductase [Leptospiraceae bacterium]HNM04017.1 FAD-dependent oxidoreductase [Leptospiraceae bacterium]
MPFSEIFEPIKIGSLVLPHRIIMGSMHLGLEGLPETADRMIAFYGRRFEGGCSFITTGGISVNHAGKGNNVFFNFQKEEDCKELGKVNAGLKNKGILCAQLFHAGRYAYHRDLVGPSAIRAPINRYVPKELTEEEAWNTIEDFGKAAEKARQCGFGAVEIMGSEGYLINQFLSPVTNTRNDFFGGNHEKRMNFGIEVMKKVRQYVGKDYPVVYRMSGIDLIPGNPDFEEVLEFAKKLKENGANALNIGIGWHESRIPTISMLVPRGAWAKIAGRFKSKLPDIPIIASNRVNVPETIQRIIKDKEADMVSMARPMLADPDFVNKVRSNLPGRVNTCIACNQACLDHTFKELMVSCLVNPEANRELEFSRLPRGKKSKVVVVGSGPGGMEAARAASNLGHSVILFEKSSRLGGQLNMASTIPGKFEFKETVRYYKSELNAHEVDVRFNTECTVEILESLNPDAVIFATGVRPREFSLPGLEKKKTGTYLEYLTGKFEPAGNVAVIGGGGIGCDSAHKLLEKHDPTVDDYFAKYNVLSYTDVKMLEIKPERKVSIFRRSGKIGAGLGATTGWALLQELKAAGAEMYTSLTYKEVNDIGLVVELKTGEVKTVECDSILICAGQERENSLAEEYMKRHPEKQVFIIGGAKEASGLDAKRAILEGTMAARKIGIRD